MTRDEAEREITNDFRCGYLTPYITDAESLGMLTEVFKAALLKREKGEAETDLIQRRGLAVLELLDSILDKEIKDHIGGVINCAKEQLQAEREYMKGEFSGAHA